jgi:two-component system chemotaxis response regulator CheB
MAIPTKIKVLIADDSAIMRALIKQVIEDVDGFDIVGTATNGRDALDKCLKLKPDVVVMDMVMGEYDGVMGTKLIMEKCPTPIIILSAMDNDNASPVMHALNAGAYDYHKKPDRSLPNSDEMDARFIKKLRNCVNVHLKAIVDKKEHSSNTNEHTFSSDLNYEIIVIGSSTGGPGAVEAVVTKLPGNLNVPVLIAQHMPPNFIQSFADRLNELTSLNVVVGKNGTEIKSGTVYIAASEGKNLIVKENTDTGKLMFLKTDETFVDFNYPSATGLMLSVVKLFENKTIGVVLTGMGKDASVGIKAIKDAGGYTIAQSKETCVVYGMPGSSVELGGVTKIVHLEEIGPFVVSCLE